MIRRDQPKMETKWGKVAKQDKGGIKLEESTKVYRIVVKQWVETVKQTRNH